jgi:adenylate kinase family enzyme
VESVEAESFLDGNRSGCRGFRHYRKKIANLFYLSSFRDEISLDVREFFHTKVKGLSDSELFAMITDLSFNPASRFGVKLRGWSRRVYPVQITLEDLWESQERANFLFVAANSKKKPEKPNTYKRAWDKEEPKKKDLKVLKMTTEEAVKFYTGLGKVRDASVTNEEIYERNRKFTEKQKEKR